MQMTESKNRKKPIRHSRPNIDNLGGIMMRIFNGNKPTALYGITDYFGCNYDQKLCSDLSR